MDIKKAIEYAYEDGLCLRLNASLNLKDPEERLVAVLELLEKVAENCGLENFAWAVEQTLLEMTGVS